MSQSLGRRSSLPFRPLLPLAVLLIAFSPADTRSQCTDQITAVILVSGIYPGTDLAIQRVALSPLGSLTFPSDDALLAAAEAVYANEPYLCHVCDRRIASAGNYHLYYNEPGDFGSTTVVDLRTGQVVFGGTIVHLGTGHVVVPASGTGPIQIVAGEPAVSPVSTTTLYSWYWDAGSPGISEEQALQLALALARETDLLHGMANCGDYSVTGYIYTPSTWLDQTTAMEVLIVSGRADSSWIPVKVEPESWGRLKALYQ